MIPYVLHVALLLAVCLLFYKLLLQKETFYRLNRYVLLACLALAFLLPLIKVPQNWALKTQNTQVIDIESRPSVLPTVVQPEPAAVRPQPTQTATSAAPVVTTSVVVWPQIFKWIIYMYWFGVAAFGLNFLLQVIVLLRQAYKSPMIVDGNFRIIEIDADIAPCSFGNNIFINPAKYEWDTYSQILLHEKIHIKQGHSLDLLLAELMLVVQWFNPFAWLYRKEVENNLEFLTDNDVLNDKNIERENYQMSLLKVCVPNLSLRITTNYNQSLLKKRIAMMNAKKSNIHTTWKYFFLVPLMAFLVCALNQPVAISRPVEKETVKHILAGDISEGVWFASIKGAKVSIQFKKEDDEHQMMNSMEFLLSELSAIPRGKNGDFTLTREAGTMHFNGKFEGNDGYGRYKFKANPALDEYLKSEGISNISDEDKLAFFFINVKKSYVAMLKNNGYKNVSKGDLISSAALKLDEPYIRFWKANGFRNLSINQMVSGKALGITEAYVSDIRRTGYPNISFNDLVSFKAQGITGDYVAKMHGAKVNVTAKPRGGKSASTTATVPASEIISYKAMNIDEAYINSIKKEGYTEISNGTLTSLKAVGVDAAYIRSFKEAGYKDIPLSQFISLKSLGVTPEFAKEFADIGYKNISAGSLSSIKALGVTPEFIKRFKNAGYQISMNEASSLKALGITPEYMKSFAAVGFDKISIGQATSLKAMGITAEYISQMRDKGFKSDDINKYITLKSAF